MKNADGKTQTIETKAIVIATGSDIAELPASTSMQAHRVLGSAIALARCRGGS